MVVNVHEAKTHFSRLILKALAGEEIIIAKNGTPVVRLTAIFAPNGSRTPGLSRGVAKISNDFDAPPADDILKEFES